jgi:hypothetical protein
MENMMNRVKVSSLFPIKDQQRIYANLESFEWNFSEYGFVYLCLDFKKIKMKYIGSGNINGNPVLTLIIADSRYKLVEDICNTKANEIFLERALEDR